MFDVVGVGLLALVRPDLLLRRLLVPLVDLRIHDAFAQHGAALGAVNLVAEESPATGHVAALREQVGPIAEPVLDRIMVEQLPGFLIGDQVCFVRHDDCLDGLVLRDDQKTIQHAQPGLSRPFAETLRRAVS